MPLNQDQRQIKYEQAAARNELFKKVGQSRKVKKEQILRKTVP